MRFPSDPSKSTKIAVCGVLTALALIFAYIEVMLPLPIGIPGIKLGIANIVVLVAMYAVGERYAFAVNLARIALVALLFGSMFSALYALCGALLSFAVMAGLKKTGIFSPAGVSMAGGVFHNMGQLAAACVIMQTAGVMYYFPVLLFSGMACGIGIGILAAVILRALGVKAD